MMGRACRVAGGRCPRTGMHMFTACSDTWHSWGWEPARVQTCLLLWAPGHVQLRVVATSGELSLLHMPGCAHAVRARMCWHTVTLPARPCAPIQLLAHL